MLLCYLIFSELTRVICLPYSLFSSIIILFVSIEVEAIHHHHHVPFNVQRSLVSYDYLNRRAGPFFSNRNQSSSAVLCGITFAESTTTGNSSPSDGGRLPSIPGLSGVTKFVTTGRRGGTPSPSALMYSWMGTCEVCGLFDGNSNGLLMYEESDINLWGCLEGDLDNLLEGKKTENC
jgi:hypothetical protein